MGAHSTFVERSISRLKLHSGWRAFDLGSGYGRNSQLLCEMGAFVLAGDLDEGRLRSSGYDFPGAAAQLSRVVLDGAAQLPVADEAFDVAIAVHFLPPDLPEQLAAVLSSGGHAVVETFGGQGENWRDLPPAGHLKARFEAFCDILKYYERSVGPPTVDAVAVKLLARKR